MLIILRNHGFNMDEYEEMKEKKLADCLQRNIRRKWSRKKKNLTKIGGYSKGIQRIGRPI